MPPIKKHKKTAQENMTAPKIISVDDYITGNNYWLEYPKPNDPLYKQFRENNIRCCAVNLSINSVIPFLESTAYVDECFMDAEKRKRLENVTRIERMRYLFNQREPRVQIQHIPREYLEHYVFWCQDNFKNNSNVKRLCEEKVPLTEIRRDKVISNMIETVERNLYNHKFRETTFFRRLKIRGRALRTVWSDSQKLVTANELAEDGLLDYDDLHNNEKYVIKIVPRLYFSNRNKPNLQNKNVNRILPKTIAKYIDNPRPVEPFTYRTTKSHNTHSYRQREIIKGYSIARWDELQKGLQIDPDILTIARKQYAKLMEDLLESTISVTKQVVEGNSSQNNNPTHQSSQSSINSNGHENVVVCYADVHHKPLSDNIVEPIELDVVQPGMDVDTVQPVMEVDTVQPVMDVDTVQPVMEVDTIHPVIEEAEVVVEEYVWNVDDDIVEVDKVQSVIEENVVLPITEWNVIQPEQDRVQKEEAEVVLEEYVWYGDDDIELVDKVQSGKEEDVILPMRDEDHVTSEDAEVQSEEAEVQSEEAEVQSEEDLIQTEVDTVQPVMEVDKEDVILPWRDEDHVTSEYAEVQSEEAEVQSEEAEVQSEEAEVQSEEAEGQSEESEVQSEEAEVQSEEAEVQSEQIEVQPVVEEELHSLFSPDIIRDRNTLSLIGSSGTTPKIKVENIPVIPLVPYSDTDSDDGSSDNDVIFVENEIELPLEIEDNSYDELNQFLNPSESSQRNMPIVTNIAVVQQDLNQLLNPSESSQQKMPIVTNIAVVQPTKRVQTSSNITKRRKAKRTNQETNTSSTDDDPPVMRNKYPTLLGTAVKQVNPSANVQQRTYSQMLDSQISVIQNVDKHQPLLNKKTDKQKKKPPSPRKSFKLKKPTNSQNRRRMHLKVLNKDRKKNQSLLAYTTKPLIHMELKNFTYTKYGRTTLPPNFLEGEFQCGYEFFNVRHPNIAQMFNLSVKEYQAFLRLLSTCPEFNYQNWNCNEVSVYNSLNSFERMVFLFLRTLPRYNNHTVTVDRCSESLKNIVKSSDTLVYPKDKMIILYKGVLSEKVRKRVEEETEKRLKETGRKRGIKTNF